MEKLAQSFDIRENCSRSDAPLLLKESQRLLLAPSRNEHSTETVVACFRHLVQQWTVVCKDVRAKSMVCKLLLHAWSNLWV
jgi:hypothetical protein